MKLFPEKLKPENKENFHKYFFERNLAYMRRDIFEKMLRGDENDYFELEKFSAEYNITNEDLNKMVNKVCSELQDLGWKTETSFGGTALFIYSTENPPPSCYPDEF